jgi:membrane protein YqaA with SNARE-associated domain
VPGWHLHRRIYDWTLAWAHRPSAAVALFALSFAESSFFPVPPDVLLMPLVLGHPRRWLRYATLCSVASVAGAVFGFVIGAFLWGQVGGFFHDRVPGFGRDRVVLADGRQIDGVVDRECLHVESIFSVEPTFPLTMDGGAVRVEQADAQDVKVEPFTKVGKLYEKYNFWIVFTAGFTPIPFKVITITAGVFGTGPEVARPGLFFTVFLIAAAASRSARFFLVAGLMRKFGPRIGPLIEKYFNLLSLLFVALIFAGFLVFKYVL